VAYEIIFAKEGVFMSSHKKIQQKNVSESGLNIETEGMINKFLMKLPGGILQLKLEDEEVKAYIANEKILTLLGCTDEEYIDYYNNELSRIFEGSFVKKIEKFLADDSMEIENEEQKIHTYNGEEKWVLISCSKIAEDNNKAIFMYVMGIDIEKHAQKNILNENATFRHLLNNEADIMFEYDIETNIIILNMVSENGTLEEKKTYKFSELVHNSGFIHESDKDKLIKMSWLDDTATEEIRIHSIDGSYIWCSVKAVALKNDDYTNKKIIGWIKNINDRKQNTQYLEDLEKRDTLTKLYNGDYVKGLIADYIRNSNKQDVSAMVILDIDNFHIINEKVGTVFGDAVLINVATEIKKVVRSDDIIARIGGDKFLIFLKNVEGSEHVIACVKRIQELISGITLGEVSSFEMTCSIGIALTSQNNSRIYQELFKNTDSALHYAKMYGKNRYEIYDKKNMSKSKNSKLYNVYSESIKNYDTKADLEKELTTEVLGIISKTKDIKEGIRKILDAIGRKFDATNVNIAQLYNKRFVITHNWSYNGIEHDDEVLSIRMDKTLKDSYISLFDNRIFTVDDTDTVLDTSQARWLIEKYGIKSFMQGALMDEDELVAVISIMDMSEKRCWDTNHCNALRAVSKILTNYLIQLRDAVIKENKINEMKNYDTLTGLPLKNNFKASVKKIIKNNPDKKYMIVNVDFIRFKYVNDTFGYDKGDKVIKDFARMIQKNQYGIIDGCRSFSDNFLLLQEYIDNDTTEILLQQMEEDFLARLRKKYVGINLGFSIGVCVIEDNYGDIMGPIDNSGLARKYAKETNKTIHFFDEEMKKMIQMEFEILNSMEHALTHSEFKVYYQPKVNIADGSIAGAEALVRWKKPNDKIISPDKFIPLFEKNGFVINLDFFVYEEVCKTMRRWLDSEFKIVPVSVNVSRIHLADKDKFINDFVSLVDKYKIPHELIELELTENIFLNNTEAAITTMAELKKLGFVLSIDDFGSGYSSLNILKDVTSDVLKLDKAFFGKDKLQKEEQIILTSIVEMARKLDIKVLSEGVETTEQSQFLKGIQCDMAQGFLYSKPVPLREFEKMLNDDMSFGVY